MYIDPGLGGMLIQGIIAAIAALSVIGVGFRSKIVAFFKRGKGISEETENKEIAGENGDDSSTDDFFTVEDEQITADNDTSENTYE